MGRFPDPDFPQNIVHQAELRYAALEQVRTHEGCEPEEIRIDEHRACLHAECERYQYKKPGHNSDHSFPCHFDLLQNYEIEYMSAG